MAGPSIAFVQPSPSARTFAILVDGDNTPPGAPRQALDLVKARGGDARVRLVFGNAASLAGRATVCNANGFRPVLQLTVTNEGKNATDVALAVAAMDLLHGGLIEAFCLVSSDSDFHPLATRLREAGREVIVLGTETTPQALRCACHSFIFLKKDADPAPKAPSPPAAKPKSAPPAAPQKPPIKDLPLLRSLFAQAYHAVAAKDGEGWADISHLDTRVRVLKPDFKVKEHGRKQFKMLVAESGVFEVKDVPGNRVNPPTQRVRLRP